MMEAYEKLRSTVVANLGIEHTITGDLLNLYFVRATEPDSLAAFFTKYDIELLEYQCVWLVSKLASKLHYKGVPREQFPRIKGVVKKFTVENGRRICALPGILEALNKADIDVMLLNGTVMKAFYEPAEIRYFSDIEILVHAEDKKRTGLILEQQGFTLRSSFWEQNLFQKNDIRIVVHSMHLRANELTGDLADIWQQSMKTSWQGKKVFVPCSEIMLLTLSLQGLEDSCSFIYDSQPNRFMNDFLDINFFLTNESLRWDKFIELAKNSKLTLHAYLMLDVLNQLYPGSVSNEMLNELPFTDKDVANLQRLISYGISKKQMRDAKDRGKRMVYYYNGIVALWNLNCYYGNRSSLLFNIFDFPRFISLWNNNKGIKGFLSKLGGFKK